MRRLISTILFLVVCFSFFPSTALSAEETLPSGIPDTKIGGKIDAYIRANKETTAGVSIAVFRNQKTIYRTACGYANIENQVIVDDETVYEWGSASKLLVWVSIMQLWELGQISFDTDIKEYLPDGFLTKLKYDAPITVLNLMNHNAGWQDTVFQLRAMDAESLLPLDEALKATEPRQVYEPGTVCAYSNWGAALAGYIVERISGQPFPEYVHENIFRPLGMDHSALLPTYSDNPWVLSKLQEAEGYTENLQPIGDGLFYINLYPAGSTAGTLEDFLTFAKAFVPNNGAATALFNKSDTLAIMFSPSLSYNGTDIDYICHGLWSYEFNVQTLGHAGYTEMYSSHFLIDPRSGVGMVIMTNQVGETVYNYGLPSMVFGEVARMASESIKTDISQKAGLYYSTKTIRTGIGKMYTVLGLRPFLSDGDGGLKASLFGAFEFNLRPVSPNASRLTQRAGIRDIDLTARFSDNGGTVAISSPYENMLQADTDVWVCTVAALLLLVAVVWSAVVLIFNFLRFIFLKLKKQGRNIDTFKKYQIMLCTAILLLVVNISSIAEIMLSSKGTPTMLMPNIAASIVLGTVPFAYLTLLLLQWRKLTCSKMQKSTYLITSFMGAAITFTILALEMYKL